MVRTHMHHRNIPEEAQVNGLLLISKPFFIQEKVVNSIWEVTGWDMQCGEGTGGESIGQRLENPSQRSAS